MEESVKTSHSERPLNCLGRDYNQVMVELVALLGQVVLQQNSLENIANQLRELVASLPEQE